MPDYVVRPKHSTVWHYNFRVGTERVRHSTEETAKGKARDKALGLRAQMLEDLKRNEEAAASGIPTFRAAVTMYDDGRGLHERDEHPTDWLVDQVGNVPITLINNKVMSNLVEAKRREARWGRPSMGPLSPTTINRNVPELVRRIIYYVRDHHEVPLPHPPTWRMHRSTEDPRKRETSMAEQLRLEAECDPEMHAIFNFAILTGLRKENLVEIRWSDIDLGMNLIKADQKLNAWHQIKMTKGMRRILLEQRSKKMNDEFIFCYRAKKTWIEPKTGEVRVEGHYYPFTYNGLTSMWQSLCNRAKVKDLTIHDLRRTFGCRTTRVRGVAVASKALGHKSAALTLKHYGHVTPDDTLEGMEATERQTEIWRQRELEDS